jgi:hypothetical protein
MTHVPPLWPNTKTLIYLSVMMVGGGLGCAPSRAEEVILTPIAFKSFKDYPRRSNSGDKGHRIVSSCFTGEWFGVVIGAGVIGKTSIPFSRLPITEERLVAVVFVNVETGLTKCFNLRSDLQQNSDVGLRARSSDEICVVVQDRKSDRKIGECLFADVVLNKGTLATMRMQREIAEQQIAMAWPHEPIPIPSKIIPSALNIKGGEDRARWLVHESPEFVQLKNSLETAPAARYLLHGSKRDRIVECNILGQGKISISEREAGGRVLWLLSEISLDADRSDRQLSIANLYFPAIPIAPIRGIVLIAEFDDGSMVLFEIKDGRLKVIEKLPRECKLSRFVVSENERYVGLELQDQVVNADTTLRIDLTTRQTIRFADHTSQEGYMWIMGITNSGAVVQEGGSSVYIATPSKEPRQILEFTDARE